MINVYPISLDAGVEGLRGVQAWLSVAEQARAKRFVRDQDRQAYIVSHAILRYVLAQRLVCGPAAVEIEVDQHGKPYLSRSHPEIHFNLSHSGQRGLIALSGEGVVGADIEYRQSKPDMLAIAERFFMDEEYTYIKCSQDHVSAFYKVWTAKEAYVKALGRGLAYGLDKFSVINKSGQFKGSVDKWYLHSFSDGADYQAAVVGAGDVFLHSQLQLSDVLSSL